MLQSLKIKKKLEWITTRKKIRLLSEKTKNILSFFDKNSSNMHNFWIMANVENKLIWSLDHLNFLSDEPYLCLRTFGDNDPLWILTSRCGSCGEYSNLFMEMANHAGLKVRRVHAPGEDHIWNEVFLNNSWIAVDPTNVFLPTNNGFVNTNFMEENGTNISYIYANYPNNNSIEDITYRYTNLTKIIVKTLDENGNPISNVKIKILSNNLNRRKEIDTGLIKKSNSTGYCSFLIGGGSYTLIYEKEENNFLSAKSSYIFSEKEKVHNISIILKKSEKSIFTLSNDDINIITLVILISLFIMLQLVIDNYLGQKKIKK